MKINDGDHVLTDGAAWIESNGFAIRLRDDGVRMYVDIYKNGYEGEDPLASCFADRDWLHEGE